MKTSRWMMTLAVAVILSLAGTAGAGNLTPPGAPGPTMHTLEELYQKLLSNEQQLSTLQQQITDMNQRVANMEQQMAELQSRLISAGMHETLDNMVLIPEGSFRMGDPFGEGEDSERPVHTVTLSAFYIDRYPVTKAQWDVVRDWGVLNDYTDLPVGGGKGPDHPVHTVSWYDVVKWCNARSEMEGLETVYGRFIIIDFQFLWIPYRTGESVPTWRTANGYRLPTEAEWEKAARGGLANQRFPWGQVISHDRANFRNTGGESYATGDTGYHGDWSEGGHPYTSPVGTFAANRYGLHDMAGNVREWCWDWYSSTEYQRGDVTDPRGPAEVSFRVLRGGSWHNDAYRCRVAYRSYDYPVLAYYRIGFRAVLPPGPSSAP